MVLIIDNYDSFSYNLYQAVGKITDQVEVVRNDAASVETVKAMEPSHVILSPGPGRPKDAGICEDLVRSLSGAVPILGVCLGHQAICEAFGAVVDSAAHLMHGKQSDIHIANGSPVFYGLPPVIKAARYHSLIARKDSLPDELLVIAEDGNGEVMAVAHRDAPTYGLQFHPESVLTPDGAQMIENFLRIGGKGND